MITSQATRDRYAIPLTRQDFAQGGLPNASNIRPSRLFTGEAGLIIRSAGRVTPDKLQEAIQAIIDIVSR
jgi:hypothetical protein